MTSQDRPSRAATGSQQTLDHSATELFDWFQACLRPRSDGRANIDGIRELVDSEDLRFTFPGVFNVGPDRMMDVLAGLTKAFRDYGEQQGTLSDITSADGTQLFVRSSNVITHTGPFQMSDGTTIEATGRTVSLIIYWSILVGPKGIRKIDATYDGLDFLRQLQGIDTQHDQSGRPTR